MPERRTSDFLAKLPTRFRDWRDTAFLDYRQWRADLSKDWTLIYRNPVGAGGFVMIGVVLGVILLRALFSMIPAGPFTGRGEAEPQYAILHVACFDSACLTAYDVRKPLDFRGWPLECEQCKKKSVYRARLCRDCKRWYAVTPDHIDCPHCAVQRHPPSREPSVPSRPIDPDDLDDR
jgi:hypothetical protein